MAHVVVESDVMDLRARIVIRPGAGVAYSIECTGDHRDHRSDDIEPGDTWSSIGDCLHDAIAHVCGHECRAVS